jgi:hypothetical protein
MALRPMPNWKGRTKHLVALRYPTPNAYSGQAVQFCPCTAARDDSVTLLPPCDACRGYGLEQWAE